MSETGQTQMTEAHQPTLMEMGGEAERRAAVAGVGAVGANRNPAAEISQDTRPSEATTRIAGVPVLKGLVLYGATLTFAGFYAYFIVKITGADANSPPQLNSAMVSAAAALSGVLGSAFALVIGVPTEVTNEDLQKAIAENPKKKQTRLRTLLSLEPGGPDRSSWPLTFGVWAYAVVASAVAIVYLLNQGETPSMIKALAIAFAGYVIAFVTAAYGIAAKR
jgi:hypothetical protein